MNTIFDYAIMELLACESSLACLIEEAQAEEDKVLSIFDQALVAVNFGGSQKAYAVAGIRKTNATMLLKHLKVLATAVTQKRVQIEEIIQPSI